MPLSQQANKYLVDSNSYFRLANSIHPLLGNFFGTKNNILYIIRECDIEFSKNTNLQNKFNWVNREEFKTNRQNQITYDDKVDNAIMNNTRFIKVFAKENYLNVSTIDIKFVAVALELNLILVTDDVDMQRIASEFEVNVMTTLDLLKLMLDCNHINIDKVKEITDYWVFNKDIPKNFKIDCETIFGLKY